MYYAALKMFESLAVRSITSSTVVIAIKFIRNKAALYFFRDISYKLFNEEHYQFCSKSRFSKKIH